jgi:hypothetical protein
MCEAEPEIGRFIELYGKRDIDAARREYPEFGNDPVIPPFRDQGDAVALPESKSEKPGGGPMHAVACGGIARGKVAAFMLLPHEGIGSERLRTVLEEPRKGLMVGHCVYR